MAAPLPFIDLGAQRARIGAAMDEAILRVVNHGAYILGPEVAALETELAAFCGASHVVSCANGTDALAMVLMAKGIRTMASASVPFAQEMTWLAPQKAASSASSAATSGPRM